MDDTCSVKACEEAYVKEENEYRMFQEDPGKYIFISMMKKIRNVNTPCWEAADGFRFLLELCEEKKK